MEGILKKNHKGVATVEASMVVPLFLFFLLAVGYLAFLVLAEAHIHQSLCEAAVDVAQYCYPEQHFRQKSNKSAGKNALVDTVLLVKQFHSYLGEDDYVEKMLVGGKTGIALTVKADAKNPKIFEAKAVYYVRLPEIFGQTPSLRFENVVRQKGLVGFSKEEKEEDPFVYITPNQAVYHLRRSCTHLSLHIQKRQGLFKESVTLCSFCGKGTPEGNVYYVSTTGIYHCREDCMGLKRTVSRVKKSEVGGLLPCSRCGK